MRTILMEDKYKNRYEIIYDPYLEEDIYEFDHFIYEKYKYVLSNDHNKIKEYIKEKGLKHVKNII